MMGGVCQYIVNEITRLYEADFFAEWLSQPGPHMCRAVATTLEGVLLLKSTDEPIGSSASRAMGDDTSRID
jgi:hypothetical protein